MVDPNNLKPSKIGRPSLTEEQKARVFGALSQLTPKTKPYREMRRMLAVEMERTERAIDLIYEALAADFLNKNGRGSDKLTARTTTTAAVAAPAPIVTQEEKAS